MIFKHLILFSFAGAFATGCITSRREEALQQSLHNLEREVVSLKKIVQEKDSSQTFASNSSEEIKKITQSLKSDMEEIKKEFSLAQGSIDELRVKMSKVQESIGGSSVTDALQKKLDDLGEKFSALEVRIAKNETAPAKATPKAAAAKEATPESKNNAKKELPGKPKTDAELSRAIDTAFKKQDYSKVLDLSNSIINNKSAKTTQKEVALQYRAEAFFAKQEYKKSAEDLSRFLKEFPKSKRSARALLLAGDSQLLTKSPQTAKNYYAECLKRFPKTEEAKAAKERLDKLGGG